MGNLKNDWYPIPKDNPDIIREAGLTSITKRERKCDERETLCDLREESLDGKPKAVNKIKKKIKLKEITYGAKDTKKSDLSNDLCDKVQVELSNDDAVGPPTTIILSPGQNTVGNDSLLDGYSHASNYSGTYIIIF